VSDLWPDELVVFSTRLFFIIFHLGRVVAKFSYIFPNIIVTISQLAAEHVTRFYEPRALVFVLPIGVDLDKFQANSKEYSRKRLIADNLLPDHLKNKFIVLYSGLISRATRVENVVMVAKKLQYEHNEISFLIVGDGEEKERLEELKAIHDIKNLIMLPFQPRELVPTIISASDLCIVSLPSTAIFDVDVPTKFYEYLACCKPQVGICGGELAKIINSNKIGFTVPDGKIDRIAEVIISIKNSPSLVSSMQKNSMSVLQRFSLDSLAMDFNIVLKSKMKKNKTN